VQSIIGGRARVLVLGLIMIGGLGLSACNPAETISRLSVADAIAVAFGPNGLAATKIATCESSLNPRAVSPGGGNHGLFQINNVHAARFPQVTGRPWSDRYDAHANARYAAFLFRESGWRPWACRRVL
jgi:hypothetical protein